MRGRKDEESPRKCGFSFSESKMVEAMASAKRKYKGKGPVITVATWVKKRGVHASNDRRGRKN